MAHPVQSDDKADDNLPAPAVPLSTPTTDTGAPLHDVSFISSTTHNTVKTRQTHVLFVFINRCSSS